MTKYDDWKPGYYTDPSNGDLWHLSEEHKWSWVNGNRFSFIPEGLVWVREGNPFHPAATPKA